MSDGRSEDRRDQPADTSGRKTAAASDLLAMWVTGKTAEEEPAPAEGEPAPAAAETGDDEPEAYAESLWPGDEPPAAGGDAGSEQWWPYAEPEGAAPAAEDADRPAGATTRP